MNHNSKINFYQIKNFLNGCLKMKKKFSFDFISEDLLNISEYFFISMFLPSDLDANFFSSFSASSFFPAENKY